MNAGRRIKVTLKNAIGLRGTKQVQVLRGPARGVTMQLDFSGHTPMYLGMFEWELHRFILDSLRGADLVFDVGGYVGYDALMFAANITGQVITFEPNADQAQILRHNVSLNPDLDARIIIDGSAIEKHEGPGLTTLDALCAAVGPPDFVKIDIDGGELDALAGGLEMLRSKRPHLLVETHSLKLENACGELLTECGYKPIIKHNRRIWREERGGAPHNRWLLATGEPESESIAA